MNAFEELENKVKVVISGLFGSITASFSVALGVSVLTPNRWTIILSGIIVGAAGSLANAASPFVSRSNFLKPNISFKTILKQSTSSFIVTFVIISLPIVSYLLMDTIGVARITSLITGLVMLFIFGVHRAEVEGRTNPVSHAFGLVLFGMAMAFVAFAVARYYILQ